jgi:hypothetical protein
MKNFSSLKKLLFILATCSVPLSSAPLQRLQLTDSLKIADVWSGHPVDFAFVQQGDSQYVAFYDTARKLSIAVLPVSSKSVHTIRLPSTIGWDSHNYIAMALDSIGLIHVSGNMHSSPLVYFQSTVPHNIDSIKQATMVGSLESSVTYPVFFYGPSGELLFMYRDGSSGNGNQIFNKWSMHDKKWSRLFDKALFDGQGQRNAYMGGPLLGSDGYYHVYWMWRETADAATTHDVCYIKSKDLLNWENAAGVKLKLPVTIATPGVMVDSIPQHGGVINRGAIGFDSQGRVIITYHKFDANGNTQLYNARWEGTRWKLNQVSNWAYRWDFGGLGSLVMKITFGPVVLEPSGVLTQYYYHVQYGTGIWQLDETTLKPESNLGSSLWPATLEQPRRSGMVVHWLKSSGLISMAGTFLNSTSSAPRDSSTVYALRWETMPENQDQPRTVIPAPTPLMLYTFHDPNVSTGVLKRKVESQSFKRDIQFQNGIIRIRNCGSPYYTLEVSNLLGQIIISRSIRGTVSIDLRSHARRGALLVNVTTGGKTVCRGLMTNIK